MEEKRLRTRFAAWIGINVLMGILASLVLFTAYRGELLCPFHTLYGVNCPGCGGSRMALALMRGDVYQAFRWNMFLFLTMPPMITLYIWQSFKWIRAGELSIWLGKLLFWYGIAFLVFGAVRLTRHVPFLDPTEVESGGITFAFVWDSVLMVLIVSAGVVGININKPHIRKPEKEFNKEAVEE